MLVPLFMEEENIAAIRGQQQLMPASLLHLRQHILAVAVPWRGGSRLERGGTRSGIIKPAPCFLTPTATMQLTRLRILGADFE
jgi:hypothetical protein